MPWFQKSEHEQWANRLALLRLREGLGISALSPGERDLYGRILPRGVPVPRFMPDRPPLNTWMEPHQLAAMSWTPGQILLGRSGGRFIGYMDDRPMVTIAGARAGKTRSVLEPNLYLYPGSILVLDPKGELTARSARIRSALGHRVVVLDPFGQSGEPSACFNALQELDPGALSIVDDVATIAQALIVDDGDSRSRHWNDSARMLTQGLILLALCLPDGRGCDLVTVRELLTLTHPRLARVIEARGEEASGGEKNRLAIETLLYTMVTAGLATRYPFGRVLAGIGRRFLNTPHTERGNIFSTAAAQTDFLDSLPMREISRRSDFALADLRGDRPTTISLVLPVGAMESHYRWLRLIVQLACIALERMGPYPRGRTPMLFMMEEFATLGAMSIMERAAAYFPGFGVKLWVVLQDINQLSRHYPASWETFLGNAGLLQCFANGDEATLDYIARRLARLAAPFELRTAFARKLFSQILMFEGEPPAALMRLGHEDVDRIRAAAIALAWRMYRGEA